MLALVLFGCTGGELKQTDVPAPLPLVCPGPNPDLAGAWTTEANASLAAANPRIKHAAMDLLGLPDGIGFSTGFENEAPGMTGVIPWTATIAVGPQERGFEAHALVGEPVSVGPEQDVSEAGGAVELPGPPPDEGTVESVLVVEADASCQSMVSARWPAGTQVVLTDIDGTLTVSDDELFAQINDGTYDPVGYDGAPEMLALWVEKGVQPVYMTARPHVLRSETRAWLQQHGYPTGPVITSSELVFSDSAAAYKLAWVERIVDALGWDVVAAYGNATTDISAYLGGGIPTDRVYIIGENAGVDGTVGVQDDWRAHTESVVRPF